MRTNLSVLLLVLSLWSLDSLAQEKNVSGRVAAARDSLGMSGASVIIKSTNTGVTTDANGNYNIKVPGNNTLLIFSSVGYGTQEIKVGPRSTIDVMLSDDQNQLNEVVVTALGISRDKKALGYSTQGIDSAEINLNHQPNVVNALQGKIAGATISSVGGGPGQGASIRIRGVNSIDVGRSNDPLFVIDGILIDNSTSTLGASATTGYTYNVRSVGNRASDINPEDIESINVLKGGAATALYGLRGASGVVVITTKKGKGRGMQVGFSSTYGFENPNKTPDLQKTYSAGILGVYTPIGLGPAWGPTIAEAKAIDATHPDVLNNNYEQAYRTGQQLRNSVSVTGGTDIIRYYSSISYFTQEGMLPFTDYKNFSARFNTDIKISAKLKATMNMNFVNSGGYKYDADRYGESLAYFSGRWNVKDYLDTNGTQLWRGTNNPIYGAATNKLKDNVNRMIGGLTLAYNPFKWLDLNYRIGLDTYNDNRFRTAPGLRGFAVERAYDNAEGFVGDFNSNLRAISSTFLATLSTKLGNDITGTLRMGHELYDRRQSDRGVLGSKLNVFDWFNLRNAANLVASDFFSEYRLMGIFGEATFDYKSFLFLSVTGRNDITSSLSKNNNSFFYPSASISYVLSESFNLPEIISYSKLRFSYARIGKDAQPYSTTTGYSAYSSLPAGSTGFTRGSNLGDPALRPEFTDTYEGGLEMAFFNNRLSFDLSYYYSLSKDQIINVNVSSATGYVTSSINSGTMRNKGLELVLKGSPVKAKNYGWDASLSFSANRNRILTIKEGLTQISYGTSGGYLNSPATMRLVPGEAYGNIYGTYWKRYYGKDIENPVRTDESRPMIIGANGFPVLSPASSQKLLGNSQPDWVGGLTNTFTYKNLSLTALLDARWGLEKFNRLENFFAAFGIADYTANRRDFKVFPGVLADGTPNTKSVWLGQAIGPDGVNYGEGFYRNYYRAISEPFVQDASWVRLRSLNLGYSLPAKWLPKNFIRSVSVSATGNNLWLHTKYYGLDPESVSSDSGSNVDGFSGFTYPAARTFLFTVNVGF
ncbi:MAG: SusC/RagA family TonB-linked outer membrane protein [Chitinophagaceae bacterium]